MNRSKVTRKPQRTGPQAPGRFHLRDPVDTHWKHNYKPGMLFVDRDLAQRIEAAEAECGYESGLALARLVPDCGTEVERIAGGVVIFAGADSPLTHVLGLGMSSPVSPRDLDLIEKFYRERNAPTTVVHCPLADLTVMKLLGERGYRIIEFENVLVRTLEEDTGGSPATNAEIEVRRVESDQADLWADVLCRGFFGPDAPEPEFLRIFEALCHTEGARNCLAWIDGQPAGGAGLGIRDGVAAFAGDSTLAPFRGRGVQAALIAARLRDARDAGCDLAYACTELASISQRNYQRHEFQPAYPKPTFQLETTSASSS